MSEEIRTYHDQLAQLGADLAERGSLPVLLIDASSLGAVEHEYGSEAYERVRQRLLKFLLEQRGKDYRATDVLALAEPEGLCFLLLLDRKRRRSVPLSAADIRSTRARLITGLTPGVARAAFPFLKTPPRVFFGHAVALYNSLLGTKRILERALAEARQVAEHERVAADLQTLERLQDLIMRERIVTAYQPILRLSDRSLLAYEALSRGARGSGLEAADALFGGAERHRLLVELDRLCRSRALLSSSRIPSHARVFVNTLPATIRDPQFRGKPLIDFLDRAQLAPSRIVIEITERLVIENYGLFQETMAYFTELGMSFAVDDVGAGYSGLEAIARLRPSFLKIDMALVRDLHVSRVNREMVKAIISLGHGIGASVIAEGIQSEDELKVLLEMNVDFGQGYLLGRPEAGPEPAG